MSYLNLLRHDCPLPAGAHVFVYCRDSGGEEQDRSVAQQVEAVREYCDHHHLVIDHIYADASRLSSNTDKRDELQSMLHDLRGRFKQINDRYKRERAAVERPFGVLFWKSNRLGRDSIEASHIKTDLRLRGITIVDLITSANTGNTAIDGLIEAFQEWQDQQLLDEISQNARRGLAQLVGTRDTDPDFLKHNPDWKPTGGYLGIMPGGTPTGFKGERIQIGVYQRKKGRLSGEPRMVQRLVPDSEVWDRCLLAWKMRHEGRTMGEIHKATHLFKTLTSYKPFFANRIYTGDLEYGGTVYEGFVPALIPKAWFEAEQERRTERANKGAGLPVHPALEPRRVGSQHLLSGMVFCGDIDGEEHPMHGESIPGKQGVRGAYSFFICTHMKNSRGITCTAKRVNMKALERATLDNLMVRVLTPEVLRPIAQKLAAAIDERSHDAGTRIAALQERLAEVQKSISNLVDSIERMGYTPQLEKRYQERQEEEAHLTRELEQLKALRVDNPRIQQTAEKQLMTWLEDIRYVLENGDRGLARQALQQFIEKLVVKDGECTLYYRLPLEGVYTPSVRDMDLRDSDSYTRLVLVYPIPASRSSASNRANPDKPRLRREVLKLRAQGMSYRTIAHKLKIHFTTVKQIIKAAPD